jgi:hypothetical protein
VILVILLVEWGLQQIVSNITTEVLASMQLVAHGEVVMKEDAGAIMSRIALLRKTGMGRIARGILTIIIARKMGAGNIITRVDAQIQELQKG